MLTGSTEDDKAFANEAIEVTGQLDPGLEPEPQADSASGFVAQ
jgi:hypothetical protein